MLVLPLLSRRGDSLIQISVALLQSSDLRLQRRKLDLFLFNVCSDIRNRTLQSLQLALHGLHFFGASVPHRVVISLFLCKRRSHAVNHLHDLFESTTALERQKHHVQINFVL